MKFRALALFATLLIAAGLVMFWQDGQIFGTFLLELVVGTISPDPIELAPPHEFSWGMKSWGNMNAELARSCVGLLLVAMGQFMLLPLAVSRSIGRAKIGLIAGFVLLLVAGILSIGTALGTMDTFVTLAQAGAANPVDLGENLPIAAGNLARLLLVVGEVLLVGMGLAAAFASPKRGVGPSQVRSVFSLVSAGFFLGFAGGLMYIGFGPLTEVLSHVGNLDPAELAGQISGALRAKLFAGVMLMFSGIFGLLAAILPAGRANEIRRHD